MAIGNVKVADSDSNIGSQVTVQDAERVSGLLFDISAHTNFWTTGKGAELASVLKDKVVELHSLQDVKDLGLLPADDSVEDALLNGIPYYHLKNYFSLANNVADKTLYLMFADCSDDWDAIVQMQRTANGNIGQFGVWTERKLWKETSASAEAYKICLVDELQTVANTLAKEYYSPAHIVLNANTAQIDGASNADTVVLSKIPSCRVDARYVTVALSQESTDETHAMQGALTSKTPVGNVGLALGLLTSRSVAESIAYCLMCNLDKTIASEIELGFGNATLTDNKVITNPMPYESMTATQLDMLDDKGYVMLIKYAAYAGVYFSKDYSCSDGDYCTISRNRTINKSSRLVRRALLPYVNSPIMLTSGGTLANGDRTFFINLITDQLNTMKTAKELSEVGAVNFDNSTNLLKTKTLLFNYSVLPIGCAEDFKITQGFTINP